MDLYFALCDFSSSLLLLKVQESISGLIEDLPKPTTTPETGKAAEWTITQIPPDRRSQGEILERCEAGHLVDLYLYLKMALSPPFFVPPGFGGGHKTAFIERPPGVPFQKIQFGNERGGRSVLFDSRSCVSRESWPT